MYLTLLEKHGLHVGEHGAWTFARPRSTLKHAYSAILATLERSEQSPISVEDVYEVLRAPPYGIKDGPLPVLLLSTLLSMPSEIALFEQGVFVPALTGAAVERLLKSAQSFQLQRLALVGARTDLLDELAGKPGASNRGVLPIVRQMIQIVRELPDYSRKTKALSEPALKVREALLRAREPAPLVFKELPEACGMSPIASSTNDRRVIVDLVMRLKDALRELNAAYPALLGRIETELARAFGLEGNPSSLRTELVERVARLLPRTTDTQLKPFLLRAVESGMGREEWLASLATVLVGRPPDTWSDQDLATLRTSIEIVRRRFTAFEALAIRADSSPDGKVDLIRLSVARFGRNEQDFVLPLRPRLPQQDTALRQQISALITNSSRELSKEEILAVLAEAIHNLSLELMTKTERETA